MDSKFAYFPWVSKGYSVSAYLSYQHKDRLPHSLPWFKIARVALKQDVDISKPIHSIYSVPLKTVSLFNVIDALTLEFESILNPGKIGEEGHSIVPIETRDYTQASQLRSAKKKRLIKL
ncbi:hypothetical protein AVEN_253514-1 [Araneus ventricosus]|uniref:Uncharacterized protein n=1 Tax=Araneus ventricosus TaxID=182803 RepID=A0A4Y2BSI6_ARAVE|nr:hypothetical protein AVEN_253514-1 [Araneus ventricosus]